MTASVVPRRAVRHAGRGVAAAARRAEQALARLRAGRTVLVVAHRPGTIDRLPRIVRLAVGRIATTEDPCHFST